MADAIRLDEWMAALEGLEARNVEGFTTLELSEAIGRSLTTTRLKVGALIRAGRVRRVGERAGVSIAGKTVYSPVYQMVKG